MARIFKCRLREILEKTPWAQKTGHNFIAEKLGVAPNTLRKMLNDDWNYVARDVVERVCDELQLSIDELFEFESVDFWEPFWDEGEAVIIRPDGQLNTFDIESVGLIHSFIESHQSGCKVSLLQPTQTGDIDSYLGSRNCIVIGSPRNNPACEIGLCKHFGMEPFSGASSNVQSPPPVFFSWPTGRPGPQGSSLGGKEAEVGKSGIRICNHAGTASGQADWIEGYDKADVKNAADCAVVLVADRALRSGRTVKTIILAGHGAVATLAAAKALLRDYRRLQPGAGEDYLLKLLNVRYDKSPYTRPRLKSFRWA